MKDNTVYNKWDNEIMVKTGGEYIYIICHEERQMDKVVSKLTTDSCYLQDYEEWDDDSDKKWILTFKVLNDYELVPDIN